METLENNDYFETDWLTMKIPDEALDAKYKENKELHRATEDLANSAREKIVTSFQIKHACTEARDQWSRCATRGIVTEASKGVTTNVFLSKVGTGTTWKILLSLNILFKIQREVRDYIKFLQKDFDKIRDRLCGQINYEHKANLAKIQHETRQETTEKLTQLYSEQLIRCKFCAACGKADGKKTGSGSLMVCSGCLDCWYCDRGCQLRDWERHNVDCKF
ncbi:predicted protein [Nematostella vectensis]|uniref:MYND-type domain-containing protein n=1 Tax=Nematostella vectensis TaxID=45351 RepID=A7T1F8_NEMVE|nr:predicted protein [Nematostella vectensis]|eukprot:XP_001622306.1 predicted protein [Nematostella vectensis]